MLKTCSTQTCKERMVKFPWKQRKGKLPRWMTSAITRWHTNVPNWTPSDNPRPREQIHTINKAMVPRNDTTVSNSDKSTKGDETNLMPTNPACSNCWLIVTSLQIREQHGKFKPENFLTCSLCDQEGRDCLHKAQWRWVDGPCVWWLLKAINVRIPTDIYQCLPHFVNRSLDFISTWTSALGIQYHTGLHDLPSSYFRLPTERWGKYHWSSAGGLSSY